MIYRPSGDQSIVRLHRGPLSNFAVSSPVLRSHILTIPAPSVPARYFSSGLKTAAQFCVSVSHFQIALPVISWTLTNPSHPAEAMRLFVVGEKPVHMMESLWPDNVVVVCDERWYMLKSQVSSPLLRVRELGRYMRYSPLLLNRGD